MNEVNDDKNPVILKKFGISQFDIIMGNPPYQRSMTKCEKRGTNAGRQTLWDKFIVSAINTPRFKEIVKATKWAAFQTDWRMFKWFKPNFYKSFSGETNTKTRKRTRRGMYISRKKK